MNAKTIITVCLLLMNMAVQTVNAQVTPSNSSLALIPQGKWVLENVSAFEGNVQIPFVDNLDCEFSTEMDIQQDEITFICKERVNKAKYDAVVRGNFLCYSVCAKWKIEENKLQLQWIQDTDGAAGIRTIVLSYSRK